jgi:type IV secretion system protein VirB10
MVRQHYEAKTFDGMEFDSYDNLGRPMLEHQQANGQVSMPTTGQTSAPPPAQSGLFFQVKPSPGPIVAAAFASLGEAGLPTAGAGGQTINADPAGDPNAQTRKLSFVGAESEGSVYNSHTLQKPASPYQVMAGTIIPATLITGVNSDLPGMVIAQVTESVWDTVSGKYLLIPQGTRLIGSYDSVVAFGQSRALLIWKRMILPNGTSMEIDNLPATDEGGYAGLSDKIDRHTWTLLRGVGLSTLLGITAIDGSTDDSDLVKALRDSTRQSANQVGQKIVDKALNVQASLSIRPGWPLRVIVHKDLILQPYAQEVRRWPN